MQQLCCTRSVRTHLDVKLATAFSFMKLEKQKRCFHLYLSNVKEKGKTIRYYTVRFSLKFY